MRKTATQGFRPAIGRLVVVCPQSSSWSMKGAVGHVSNMLVCACSCVHARASVLVCACSCVLLDPVCFSSWLLGISQLGLTARTRSERRKYTSVSIVPPGAGVQTFRHGGHVFFTATFLCHELLCTSAVSFGHNGPGTFEGCCHMLWVHGLQHDEELYVPAVLSDRY